MNKRKRRKRRKKLQKLLLIPLRNVGDIGILQMDTAHACYSHIHTKRALKYGCHRDKRTKKCF
jgi:hypothetical protein